MRFITILSLIFFVSLTPVHVRAQTDEALPLYQYCENYAECTIVWGGCSDVAINKRYVQQFKPTSVCSVTKPHDPSAVPTCEENMCVVVSPDKNNGPVN